MPAASFRVSGVELCPGLPGAGAQEASHQGCAAGEGPVPAATILTWPGRVLRWYPSGHAAARPDLGAAWRVRARGPGAPAPAPGEWVLARGGAGLSEPDAGARGSKRGAGGLGAGGGIGGGGGALGFSKRSAFGSVRARASLCPRVSANPCLRVL